MEYSRFKFSIFLLLDGLPDYLPIAELGRRVGFMLSKVLQWLVKHKQLRQGFELEFLIPFPTRSEYKAPLAFIHFQLWIQTFFLFFSPHSAEW